MSLRTPKHETIDSLGGQAPSDQGCIGARAFGGMARPLTPTTAGVASAATLGVGGTALSSALIGDRYRSIVATLQAFRDMGVVIEGPHNGRVTIHGVGLHGLQAPHRDDATETRDG